MPCNLPRGSMALAVQTTNANESNEFYREMRDMYIFGYVTSICIQEMIPVALIALLLLAWRHVAGFEETDVPSRWRSIDLLPQSLSPLYLTSQKTCGNVRHMSIYLGV